MIKAKVFCGGRFHFDYPEEDFVKKASEDYRAILLGDVNKLLRYSGTVKINDNISYIGPYYFETDDMTDREIIRTEMRMIEECDIAFFLLEDGTCPGTVSEMIYAASLQKRMCIVYIRNDQETESSLRSACWYPITVCRSISKSEIEVISCDDREQAKSTMLNAIKNSLFRADERN